MGGPKALVEFGGETLLARALRLYDHPAIALRVVVLGCEAARARSAAENAAGAGVAWVVNDGWESGGMLSSVLRGLDNAARAGADAVLLHPVDHPAVDVVTVDAVVAALARGAAIAVPVHAGRRGHPGGFSRSTFEALRAAPPDEGARVVLAGGFEVVEVAAGPGCRRGIDTPADLARLQAGEGKA
ncbi:MAG: NTP transferase domain-containing protein [Vicinamibacteria bacterium]|nr:NTP transferase domain-containing protein [Vicinamibacteria bacterium]